MINDLIKEKAKFIDRVLEEYLPKEEGPAATVMRAMNSSIRVGGKRLRPMLMMETYRMFGGNDDTVIRPFMAAIEMIHTYSLCHDDLPAMDNDMYRRGKKSTHAEFGEAMGILAGDALLNYAFETALGAFDASESVGTVLSDSALHESRRTVPTDSLTSRISQALRIIANKAGIYGMIGGQVVDIESEDESADVTMDTIRFIHENKTAAMIESSMMIGAVLAGATKEETDVIEAIGSDIGLAFQIRDDILDVVGSDETLGKPVGSDARNGKATYVSLVGLDKARQDVREISDRAKTRLAGLRGSDTESGQFLKGLIETLIDREY